MTDIFKELCAELTKEVEEFYEVLQDNGLGWISPGTEDLLERARAALAQPEPVGPTDEDFLIALKAGIAAFPPRHPEAEPLSAVEYEVELEIRKARAVLSLARLGTPANNTSQDH